ncbi:hypothetical protein [Sphingobacterium yanglingense]|uniref:Uncharacterized protein n=1 Tax=Sphingobacterium yanglingense TaxID=1437280 RepID=A0A4R6WKV9_9SPHI|nr:hypothetical protein [Sphingobacterium yanglingense]TDQ79587.1 hypothetical protein CLV99_1032 [Sphingobacterium yanglingense]
MKETTQDTINAFLDEGDIMNIPILPKNKWHGFLQKIGVCKKHLTYTLRRIRVGNRERIAQKGLNIPDEINDGTPLLTKIFELSTSNNADLIYCAAVALQNDRNEPTEELLDTLKWVDDDLLYSILERGLSEIDIQNFLKSIVLMKGTNSLMKTETQ